MFRNLSPKGAGLLAFLLVIAIWILMVTLAVLIGPAAAATPGGESFMGLLIRFIAFMQNWGLFMAIGAGVIVYFWKRSA